jgi:hypothetical protein
MCAQLQLLELFGNENSFRKYTGEPSNRNKKQALKHRPMPDLSRALRGLTLLGAARALTQRLYNEPVSAMDAATCEALDVLRGKITTILTEIGGFSPSPGSEAAVAETDTVPVAFETETPSHIQPPMLLEGAFLQTVTAELGDGLVPVRFFGLLDFISFTMPHLPFYSLSPTFMNAPVARNMAPRQLARITAYVHQTDSGYLVPFRCVFHPRPNATFSHVLH